MRVVDLDRDMSDVIPTGLTPDSEFLFEQMTQITLDSTRAGPGSRVLDVASGVGQDSLALAARGASVIGAEPSRRMTGMAQLFVAEREEPHPLWVRGWADHLSRKGALMRVSARGRWTISMRRSARLPKWLE